MQRVAVDPVVPDVVLVRRAVRVLEEGGVVVFPTDTLYALKRLAMDKKIYPDKFPVYALSRAFVHNLYKYGRNFELGLGAAYFLKTNLMKAFGQAGFGIAMMSRGRLSLRPHTIKKIHEMRAIIDRANELEGV